MPSTQQESSRVTSPSACAPSTGVLVLAATLVADRVCIEVLAKGSGGGVEEGRGGWEDEQQQQLVHLSPTLYTSDT